MLSAVFDDCHSRWGGRFNLVVPCVDGKIEASYREWLSHYDPDIIYSYVELEGGEVEKIHSEYYPSYFDLHWFAGSSDERTIRSFEPRIPTKGLASYTLIPALSKYDPGPTGGRPRLCGHYFGARDHRPLVDSFGNYLDSFGRWSPAEYFNEFIEYVTLIPPDRTENEQNISRNPAEEIVTSTSELMDRMRSVRTITLAQLSSFWSPRLVCEDRDWATSFTVVVGDTFTDRVVFWNCRSLYPRWLDPTLVCVRLSPHDIDDVEFVESFAEYLKRHNNVRPDSNSSTPAVKIISSSIDQEALEGVAEALKSADKWSHYQVQKIDSVSSCVPPRDSLNSASFIQRDFFDSNDLNDWSDEVVHGEELRVTPNIPAHLQYTPAQLSVANHGGWGVDIDIDRKQNHADAVNITHTWILPRRLRMAGAFIRPYQLDSNLGYAARARANKQGNLVIFGAGSVQIPSIHVPTDEQAFRYAFLKGGDWPVFDRRSDRSAPVIQQHARSVETSTQGRYLRGVIDQLGGFSNAKSVLLNEFWFDLFESLGASSRASENSLSDVGHGLKDRFRKSTIDLNDEKTMDLLAREVHRQARKLRIVRNTVSWSRICARFADHQERSLQSSSKELSDEEIRQERERERNSLERTLQDLCQSGVFFRGKEWGCKNCSHVNWVSIERLGLNLTCEICGHFRPTDIDSDWDFRLNPFFVTALRDHGIISLVWALSKLQGWLDEPFYYLGPTDVYLDQYAEDADGPDGDVDLTVVHDREVALVEVKQSSRNLDVQSFVRIAQRLRPDRAVLAVMEEPSNRCKQAVSSMKTSLEKTYGVRCELINLATGDMSDQVLFGLTRYRIGFGG